MLAAKPFFCVVEKRHTYIQKIELRHINLSLARTDSLFLEGAPTLWYYLLPPHLPHSIKLHKGLYYYLFMCCINTTHLDIPHPPSFSF